MYTALLKAQVQNYVDEFRLAKPLFRHLSLALLASCALSQLLSPFVSAFSLTASDVFSFHLWRVFTSFFVETNVFLVLWSVFAVYQFTVIIVPVWGLREVAKYVAVVQLSSTLAVAAIGLFLMAITRTISSVDFYFYGHINGLSAASVAALVAIKQFLPDATVVGTQFGRVKNSHMPLNALLLTTFLWLFGLCRGAVPLQVLFGFQISFVYLRFYQPHLDVDLTGDDSEHFTWASFFPRRLQPLALVVSRIVFRSLVAARICKPIKHAEMSDLHSVQTVVPPEYQNRDAERRRQKALRELNERLNRTKTGSAPHLQSLQVDSVPMAGTGLISTALPPPLPLSATASDSLTTATSSTSASDSITS